LSLKYKKLKKYFPAEILYSHFHNTKSVFLDSSLKNKYGKYSVIGLYPYLEVKESNNILKINDKETKGNLLDFLDSYIKENKQESTDTHNNSLNRICDGNRAKTAKRGINNYYRTKN
jgi:para-aminobenzoate synthetase component 1